MQFPELTDIPDAQRGRASIFVRYEDIAQDGSLKVGGMLPGVGLVAMGKLWFKNNLSKETRPLGIIPLLSRLVLQSGDGPMAVRTPFESEAVFRLAHCRDDTGAVTRIVLHAAAELFAPAGRTHPPQPANFGERLHVGRVFTEHVFTKPFGPPQERKVVVLPSAEGPTVPGPTIPQRDPLEALALPAAARWLEPELALDVAPLVFGLTHTDSNQHVNSLVYPQLFEDAALRRLHELGRETETLLVDHMDVSFRKPCFAGERMRVWVRALALADGKLGAVGYLGPEGCEPARAHTLCALTFRRERRKIAG